MKFDFFGMTELQPTTPPQTARRRVVELVGAEPAMVALAPLLREPVMADLVDGRAWWWQREMAWYVYVDAPAAAALKTAKRIRRGLKALRNLHYSEPGFHSRTLYVGCADGSIQEVA